MRRALARLMVLLAVVAGPSRAAEEVAVPVGLQAELLTKVAAYDRNFAARAGDRAHVLILTRPGDAESVRTAAHMETALRGIADIGGLPHDETTLAYPGAKALADMCKARHVAIVYVAPALGGEIDGMRDAL